MLTYFELRDKIEKIKQLQYANGGRFQPMSSGSPVIDELEELWNELEEEDEMHKM